MKKNEIQENNTELSLTNKSLSSLAIPNKEKDLTHIIKTATGIIFYTASFIVSVAIGYLFIFSVFN